MNTNKFSVKDLPCESVVVYQDRAEVKRLIKTKLSKGENELILKCFKWFCILFIKTSK